MGDSGGRSTASESLWREADLVRVNSGSGRPVQNAARIAGIELVYRADCFRDQVFGGIERSPVRLPGSPASELPNAGFRTLTGLDHEQAEPVGLNLPELHPSSGIRPRV